MKRLIAVSLALILTFAGCTKAPVVEPETPDPVVEESALETLQAKIRESGKLIGVAYLGWIEGDAATAKAELFAKDFIANKELGFIKDIEHYAEYDGYRMYAIVPADESVLISVSKCEFDDDFLPYAGEQLVMANAPILVRGVMSDTIPNLLVIAENGEDVVKYTPIQSGMDGRLENSSNLVYDFTPYEYMEEFYGVDRVPDAVFCGSWITFANDGNGEERTLGLELNPDGTASYVYGIGNSEVLEQFEGTWSLGENDILKLELVGGPPESVENPIVAEPYDCNPSFEWEMTTEGLSLTHIDGDAILYGTNGATFAFTSTEE